MSNPDSDFTAYNYTPSLAAAVVFTVVFGFSTAIHIYQCGRTQAYYMIPLIVGGIGELAGYICRIKAWSEAPDYQLTAYIVQTITILIAPAFTAATIYIAFGRIMLVSDGESRSLIRQRFLTLVFICGDVFSLCVQSSGASILSQNKEPNSTTIGKWIVTGGLFLQVIFFGVFILVAVVFHRRLARSPTAKSKLIPDLWRVYLRYLYAASALVVVRSVFRVIEYIQGEHGYLLSHEIYLYIFDATLMALAMLLFNIVHPTMITALLNGTKATHLLRVYTLEKLDDGIPGNTLQGLRHQTGSGTTNDGCDA